MSTLKKYPIIGKQLCHEEIAPPVPQPSEALKFSHLVPLLGKHLRTRGGAEVFIVRVGPDVPDNGNPVFAPLPPQYVIHGLLLTPFTVYNTSINGREELGYGTVIGWTEGGAYEEGVTLHPLDLVVPEEFAGKTLVEYAKALDEPAPPVQPEKPGSPVDYEKAFNDALAGFARLVSSDNPSWLDLLLAGERLKKASAELVDFNVRRAIEAVQ